VNEAGSEPRDAFLGVIVQHVVGMFVGGERRRRGRRRRGRRRGSPSNLQSKGLAAL